MISVPQLSRSIRHALRGMQTVYRSEQNFRIQTLAAVCVLFLAVWFEVSTFEFIVLGLLIVAVLSLEIINSIFERIVDTFKPRIHPIVRDIKDIMAAAVLLVSVGAAVIGITIFFPYIFPLFEGLL